MGKRTSGMMPSYVMTIGAMVDRSVEVRVICQAGCGYRDLDLAGLIAAKGRDYSLLNRRCRCRLTPGCTGWNRFYYLGHGRMCPLWDDATARRWIEQRWNEERGLFQHEPKTITK